MAKLKSKDINNLATELRNKFNGLETGSMRIGVVVCANTFDTHGYSFHLARLVEKEVIKNGCEAEILFVPALNERFRKFNDNNFVLSAYRKQIANFFELTLFEKSFDGVVFIPSGFNSTIGCLLSSIRLNLPTLVLPQGFTPMAGDGSLNQILSLPGQVASNTKSAFDAEKLEKKFCEKIGSGCVFTVENIFNIILEIMELTTRNASCTFAGSYEKESQAIQTAQTIVRLTKNRLPLKRMINKKSLNNALILNFCLGGSPLVINALVNLAEEAELEPNIVKIIESVKGVPVLYDTNLGVEDFMKKGGTWGLIKAMVKNDIIDGNYKTFSDDLLKEETNKVTLYEDFLTPINKESLIIMRGNIAEKFALVKTCNLTEDKTKVIANALVFSSDQEACNAVLNKALTDNAIIVIKDCGKNVDTGETIISQTAIALESMNLTDKHIIITDGFVIDDTKVISISFVSPDSESGNIKYIKDGDEIEIDFVKGRLNVEVNVKEMALRQKKYVKEHRILPKYFDGLK